MHTYVAIAIVLVATLYAQVQTQEYYENTRNLDSSENVWSSRSLKIESSAESSSSIESQYRSYTPRSLHPNRQRLIQSRYPIRSEEANRQFSRRSSEDDDYDIDENYDDDGDNNDRYRGGGGKKGGKKRGQEEEEDPLKKYVPQFWLGKPKQGWGNSHVEQVGWIINKDSPGGWSVDGQWPSGWTSNQGLAATGLQFVDGEGWVGTVGAPWKKPQPPQWGPGFGHIVQDDQGGKKGKKGKKGKGGGKSGGGKGGKGGKGKKKKRKRDPCAQGGKKKRGKGKNKGKGRGGNKSGGGKGGRRGGGWMKDECEKGPKPWFGWPQKIKFIPPPPKGSQIWLKPHPPKNHKSGWSDYHGWDWIKKLHSGGGWGVSDLVGVVHL